MNKFFFPFLVILLFSIPTSSAILITEVAPTGGGGFVEDWIELQNTGSLSQDLTGWAIGDLDPDGIPETRRYVMPAITLAAGQRLVVHYKAGLDDTVINDNNPGYWDLFVNGTEDVLPSTYETVVLYNDSNTIVDAIIYQVADSTYYDSDVNTIEDAGEWIREPTEEQTEENIYFDPFVRLSDGYGIKRISTEDSNTSADWALEKKADMTPGSDNLSIIIGDTFDVQQNYPNPFLPDEYPVTKIKVNVTELVKLKIKIYDITGALIKVIVEEDDFEPGQYIFSWDGLNDKGKEVQSGTFLIMVTDGSKTKIKKMTILR